MQLQFLSMSNTFLFLAARRVVISILFREYKHGDNKKTPELSSPLLLVFLGGAQRIVHFHHNGLKSQDAKPQLSNEFI